MHEGEHDAPQSFSQWVLWMIYYFLFVVGAITALMINYERGLFIPTSDVAIAAKLEPLLPEYGSEATLTGTILYYPNNVGEAVPYIRYDTASGVMTKALLLTSGGDLPPEGTPITVTGALEFEHVRVHTIALGP